jgi:tRNA-specific 2-thiouridylase
MISNNKNVTVAVAMSGGVDSSVSAYLLKEQGYKLIGLTLKTWGYDKIPENDSGCCSLDTIYRAGIVADQLGIPHYTLDFTEKFNDVVINNFINEYLSGRTPNPCVLCNKEIKWGALLEKAESLGADYIATGHYAKILKLDSGRYTVSLPEDKNKDQTYFLWSVSQYALSKTIFPLGEYSKPEIRDIAAKLNLKSASTPDSQEICFVPDNDYSQLIEIRLPDLKEKVNGGDIIYKGEKVGKHKGYPFYTIGQRKGLNVALGKPVYVSKIDSDNNLIILDDEKGLYSESFSIRDINLLALEKIEKPLEVKIKIRYKDPGTKATIEHINDNRIFVKLHTPKKSVTPGQSAVFYSDSYLIGGGVIE